MGVVVLGSAVFRRSLSVVSHKPDSEIDRETAAPLYWSTALMLVNAAGILWFFSATSVCELERLFLYRISCSCPRSYGSCGLLNKVAAYVAFFISTLSADPTPSSGRPIRPKAQFPHLAKRDPQII